MKFPVNRMLRLNSRLRVPLAIAGEPVLTVPLGEAYAGFVAIASGGRPPYTFSLVGDWPPGITIDPETGAVSGVPFAGA